LRAERGRPLCRAEPAADNGPMTSQMRHHLVHAGWLAAALAALGGVFALYVHPEFLVTLVDQVWSCF